MPYELSQQDEAMVERVARCLYESTPTTGSSRLRFRPERPYSWEEICAVEPFIADMARRRVRLVIAEIRRIEKELSLPPWPPIAGAAPC